MSTPSIKVASLEARKEKENLKVDLKVDFKEEDLSRANLRAPKEKETNEEYYLKVVREKNGVLHARNLPTILAIAGAKQKQ